MTSWVIIVFLGAVALRYLPRGVPLAHPENTILFRFSFSVQAFREMGFHPLLNPRLPPQVPRQGICQDGRPSDNSSLCFIIITNASFVK